MSVLADRTSVGPVVELARYQISSGERVILGQRVNGVVRVVDRPAGGRGRSVLVERGLEVDGHAALLSLVSDYVEQARRHDEMPMLVQLLEFDDSDDIPAPGGRGT